MRTSLRHALMIRDEPDADCLHIIICAEKRMADKIDNNFRRGRILDLDPMLHGSVCWPALTLWNSLKP
jgi:hypothetical protein